MSCVLYLGDRAYSSWSLRAWLLFDRFGLSADMCFVRISGGKVVTDGLAQAVPARTVPTLVTPEGAVASESLAIAEELASRHPEAGLWPEEPGARAAARSLAAEMHSGFAALRGACPMNLRVSYAECPVSPDVREDIDRIEEIWSWARSGYGHDGPWLAGRYSIADAFFAPVAARIAGYALPVGPDARAYVDAHLADPAFRRWRAMSLVEGPDMPVYARDFPQRPWPGPAPIPARAVETGPSENARCPYSGEPAAHFLETDGRVFGFCNAFSRDKTVADPAVWPAFMEMLGRA